MDDYLLPNRASELSGFKESLVDAGTCSVCGGQPLASGRPCVCGGKGTYDAEVVGLRLYIFELEDELERARPALSAAEEWGKASAALQKADEAVANSPGNEYKQRSLAAGKAFGEEQDKLASLRKAVDELRRARGEKEGEG